MSARREKCTEDVRVHLGEKLKQDLKNFGGCMKQQTEYSKEQISAMLVQHLQRFAVRQKKPFEVEKARARWNVLVSDKDYPIPHPNAWGAAWKKAKENLELQGYLVERVAFKPAVSALTHGHPVSSWLVKKVA